MQTDMATSEGYLSCHWQRSNNVHLSPMVAVMLKEMYFSPRTRSNLLNISFRLDHYFACCVSRTIICFLLSPNTVISHVMCFKLSLICLLLSLI